ncbi:MAG TPA: hypothetical protein VFS43_44380 [Polyangiaceae bacterium]|nr:hypothetical protein [Polyangiaceae bacterium]
MAGVTDYVVIQGNSNLTIGDGNQVLERNFTTAGRLAAEPAILAFDLRGLTNATQDVPVRINGVVVGSIAHYPGELETAPFTFHQTITIGPNILRDGTNELEIRAVTFPGSSSTNVFDDFDLSNIVCYFKVSPP